MSVPGQAGSDGGLKVATESGRDAHAARRTLRVYWQAEPVRQRTCGNCPRITKKTTFAENHQLDHWMLGNKIKS